MSWRDCLDIFFLLKRVFWSILFGFYFALLVGFSVWIIGESDRGAIKGEWFNKISGVIFGVFGGISGFAFAQQEGWLGVLFCILLWLLFSCVGGCAARL